MFRSELALFYLVDQNYIEKSHSQNKKQIIFDFMLKNIKRKRIMSKKILSRST